MDVFRVNLCAKKINIRILGCASTVESDISKNAPSKSTLLLKIDRTVDILLRVLQNFHYKLLITYLKG